MNTGLRRLRFLAPVAAVVGGAIGAVIGYWIGVLALDDPACSGPHCLVSGWWIAGDVAVGAAVGGIALGALARRLQRPPDPHR